MDGAPSTGGQPSSAREWKVSFPLPSLTVRQGIFFMYDFVIILCIPFHFLYDHEFYIRFNFWYPLNFFYIIMTFALFVNKWTFSFHRPCSTRKCSYMTSWILNNLVFVHISFKLQTNIHFMVPYIVCIKHKFYSL